MSAINIWADGIEAELLNWHGRRGRVFVNLPDVAAERAVSVTVPVRLTYQQWDIGMRQSLKDA